MERVKNFPKTLGVESVFIVIVAAVIVGILSYLNIIPLGKLLSSLRPTQQPPGQQLLSSPTLSFVSDIPGVAITAPKRAEFEKLFTSWDIYTYLKSRDLKNQKVHEVFVHLTNIEQPYVKVSNPKTGVILSSNITVQNGQADIFIYVADAVLNSNPPQDAGSFLTSELLSTVWGVTHTVKSQAELEVTQKEKNALILDFLNKNKGAVVISKG